MIVSGAVTNVYITAAGSELATDEAIGSTSLGVTDAYPFSSDGGQLSLNGVVMTYTAVDYEANTLTVPALATAALTDDEVLVVPSGSVKIAMIDPLDGDEGFRAIVPFTMASLIDDGMRDYNEQERVLCSDETGRWEVKSLDEEIPSVLGGYVDPVGLPIASDGLAPATSPKPDVLPGVGSIFIKWKPITNPDIVTYDVYLYTSSGATLTPALLLGSTQGAMLNTKFLPDGVTALVNGTTYFSKVIARDIDGSAPASAEGSGAPLAGADPAVLAANVTQLATLNGKFPITTTDITPGAITTPTMTANSINGDRVTANTINANKIIANSITASQIAANTITASLIAANTLTANEIAANAITATEIAATTITAAKIAANTITSAQIAAGTITATQIASNTITTDKMIIGGGNVNWIANPGFEDGTIFPHLAIGAATLTIYQTTVRSGAWAAVPACGATRVSGAMAYDIAFGGPVTSAAGQHMPVKQGDVIYGELWIRSGSGSPEARVYIDHISATGTRLSNTQDTGQQGYWDNASPPAFHAGSLVVTSAWTRIVTRATMVAGAAYTSLNLAFAGCTVGQTTIIDDLLLAKQVAGELIVNGAITAKLVSGDVIGTAASGQRMEMSGDTSGGVLQFFSGSATETAAGYLNPGLGGTGGVVPIVTLATGKTTVDNSIASIIMAAGHGLVVGTEPSITLNAGYVSGNGTNRFDMGLAVAFFDRLGIGPSGTTGATGSIVADTGITSGAVLTGQQVRGIAPGASASAANVRWNAAGTGEYLVNTSLTKHKVKISEIPIERLEKLLDVPVVEFYDRQEWIDNGRKTDGLQLIPGVLAEAVQKADPTFADYSADGDLVSVMYDRLGLALIPLVKNLYKRVKALEEAR